MTVYELVSDITRMGGWSPECYRCEGLDGATRAVEAARFRGHRLGKIRWHTDAIITAADPGREFAFATLHKEVREENVVALSIPPPQCRHRDDRVLPISVVPRRQRIAELPIPRDKQLRRGIQETLHRIKTAAEQVRD